MTKEQWESEAVKRYGRVQSDWKFRCPSCQSVMSVQDYVDAGKAAGATRERVAGMIAFSCVGRLLPDPAQAFTAGGKPCRYAGGGLFRLNPIDVEGHRFFDFADDPLEPTPQPK